MGKAPARAVTDDELLSEGSDDSLDQLDDEAVDRDEHQDDGPKDNDQDNLEVVILDEDEGKDKPGKDTTEDEQQSAPVDDDDGGEEVDTEEPRGELTNWEKKNYNKAMQARILRERRIKERSVAQAQQEIATAANAIRAARAETLEAQKLSTALLVDLIARDIEAKQTAVLAAKETEDHAAEVKLMGELADLHAKKRDVEAAKDRLDRAKPAEVRTEQVVKQSPDTQAWISRNRWFGNKQFNAEVSYTRALDTELAEAYKAGRFAHAPGTARYFTELDRQIHAKMPTLRAQIRKTYGEPRRSASSAPVSRGAPAKPGNKVTLTRADLENMRSFGLDPKNQAHLKEYAMSKRASNE